MVELGIADLENAVGAAGVTTATEDCLMTVRVVPPDSGALRPRCLGSRFATSAPALTAGTPAQVGFNCAGTPG